MKNEIVHFALCLNNEGYPASLEVGKLYRVIDDEQAAAENLLRVVDESGEDYLYHNSHFVFLELPLEVEQALVTA